MSAVTSWGTSSRTAAHVICVDNIVPLTGGIDPDRGWPIWSPRDFVEFEFIHRDCPDYFSTSADSDVDLALHLAAIDGGREMIEINPLAVAEDLAIDSMYCHGPFAHGR